MRHLIVPARQDAAAGADEAETTVLHGQDAAIEPQETVSVAVGDARGFEAEPALQHRDLDAAGRSSSMPKPKAR